MARPWHSNSSTVRVTLASGVKTGTSMHLNVPNLPMHTAFSVERTQGEELESKCADILINGAQDQSPLAREEKHL